MKKKIRCLLYVLCYAIGIFSQPQRAQSNNDYTAAPNPVYTGSEGIVASPAPFYSVPAPVLGAHPPAAYYPQTAPAPAYGAVPASVSAYPPLPQAYGPTPLSVEAPQPPVLLQAPVSPQPPVLQGVQYAPSLAPPPPPQVYAPTPPAPPSPPVIQGIQSTPPSAALPFSVTPPLPLPSSGAPIPPSTPVPPSLLPDTPPVVGAPPLLPVKPNSPPKAALKPLKKIQTKRPIPPIKGRPPIPDTPQARAEAALYAEPLQAFCKNGKVAGMAAIRHASRLKRSPGPIAVTYSLTPPKKGEGLRDLNKHCTDQKSELDLDRLNGVLKKYGYLTGTPKQAALSKKQDKDTEKESKID